MAVTTVARGDLATRLVWHCTDPVLRRLKQMIHLSLHLFHVVFLLLQVAFLALLVLSIHHRELLASANWPFTVDFKLNTDVLASKSVISGAPLQDCRL